MPLFVMIVFAPSTVIKTVSLAPMPSFVQGQFPHGFPFVPYPPSLGFFGPLPIMVTETLSITGLICLVGLAMGAFFVSVMMLFGDKLTRRILHVIELAPEEHPWLKAKVTELSEKLAISTPKVGITEDLRPNAFTIGYGRKTTLVFSVGLLNVLNKEELVAVSSHELVHVKNRDFFYKIWSSALTSISFFNPFAYFATSSAQREREMLADEGAAKLLEKPFALQNALAKICAALVKLPKEPLQVRMTANLFVTSSILRRPQILAVHPNLDQRFRNISESTSASRGRHFGCRKVIITAVLCLLVIVAGVFASYGTIRLQASFMSATAPKLDIVNHQYPFDNQTPLLTRWVIPWVFNVSQTDTKSAHVPPMFNIRPANWGVYNTASVVVVVVPGDSVSPYQAGSMQSYGNVNGTDAGLPNYR